MIPPDSNSSALSTILDDSNEFAFDLTHSYLFHVPIVDLT